MSTSQHLTREKVMECLKRVGEPLLKKDMMSLGLVREISIDETRVFLHMEDPSGDSKMLDALKAEIGRVLQESGATSVEIQFSGKSQGGKSTEFRPGPIRGVKQVIAVASGKGGVGKSTVAVNLALALAKMNSKVGIMDADIYGPNIPLMLGVRDDQQPEGTTENKILPLEAHGIKVISIGLFTDPDKPIIWRGPLLHKTIQEFLHRVEWGELDYLVVDLPPGTGDVQLSLSQWTHVSGVVVVTTPQEVALSDVRRAVNMFRQLEIPILGIVENMTGPVFGKGGGEKMAEDFQIPFLGDIPLDAQVRKCGDSGVPLVAGDAKEGVCSRFLNIAEALRESFYKNIKTDSAPDEESDKEYFYGQESS
ncbi:MAG TPA: Mrp/NBP35 family ATP-binding protein [Candidatus Omnitrophota bacterium]|nr:Mrp/NBP35 family ATP-binding protein [Candidatus Omnitrophota bacterium]